MNNTGKKGMCDKEWKKCHVKKWERSFLTQKSKKEDTLTKKSHEEGGGRERD